MEKELSLGELLAWADALEWVLKQAEQAPPSARLSRMVDGVMGPFPNRAKGRQDSHSLLA